MGLLQKANEKNIHTPEVRKKKFPAIKERLHKIKNTINFHPTLFKELADLFSIEKGALLVRDGDKFSLTSIIGYDETTNNRLRLTQDEYNNYINDRDISTLERYFSIREFKTVNRLILIPFKNGIKTEGLLLISEFKTVAEPSEEELKSYIKELEELWKENPLIRLKEASSQSSNIKDSITSFVQKIKNRDNRVIFLKISLNQFIQSLIKDDPHTTLSSVKNSMLKVLTSFVQKRGKVFQLSNNEVIIVILDKKCSINVAVMQQQITGTFATVFSRKTASINLNYETLTWKDNSLDTILNHFIPDEIN